MKTFHAAHAFWHFAQVWFTEFPAYQTADDRISLWGMATLSDNLPRD